MSADPAAEPVLAAPVRTPLGKLGGRLARLTAADLGIGLTALVEREAAA